MDLIEVSGLTKRYGGIVALEQASFSARAGEVHALIGENGAGKSTFIQILAGAVPHDGGDVLFDGAPYSPANPDDAETTGVTAVFQELSLIPDLTVEENIWFRREPRRWWGAADRRELRRKTLDLFEKYEFPPIQADRDVRRLTLAEQQIVEIAKGLAKSTRVLILDEATSALPAKETEWLLKLTRKLAQEGLLVIFISHRMGEVRSIADRMTIFRNGSTVATHVTDEVSDDEIVAQMIGRQMDRLYPERHDTTTGRIALKVSNLECGSRLRGVGFELREGEVLGVGGLQGHGHRELFQSLFGASRSTGEVELWGRTTRFNTPSQALSGRDGIALVPEDRGGQGLLNSMSVRENLTLSVQRRMTWCGLVDAKREAALVREMVDLLSIKVKTPEQEAGTLSGGNQQKVVFGKMLLTEARVLLLYDPTRGVDVGTKSEIFQLMRDLAAQGYAILFHSSDMPELVHVCDRVMVLRGGHVAALLDRSAISEEAILRAAVLEKDT